MPREVATILCLMFITGLWIIDARHRPPFSKALWIPLIWLLLLGSRQFSWWLWFVTGIAGEATSDIEGNLTDRVFYSALIIAALIVVTRRGVRWSAVFSSNPGLAAFYLYLGLTILWAAYPLPTAKRWIKELGAIPVLLIILTEEHPVEAIKAVFTRCAYFLFSFSILAEKYIPDVGRIYSPHNGLQQTVGITWQKNTLGEVVMVFGLVVIWQLVEDLGREQKMARILRVQLLGTLAMGMRLLYLSESKSALVCFTLGIAIILSPRIPFLVNHRKLTALAAILAFPAFMTADRLWHISAPFLRFLGRDETFTNRTEIWQGIRQAITENPINEVIGAGYLNFWDMVRSLKLGGVDVAVQTAHNGYIDVYLDGGIIGCVCLAFLLLSLAFRYARLYAANIPGAALALAFFCMILPQNFAESSLARRGPLWMSFLLCVLWSSWSYYVAYRPAIPEAITQHELNLGREAVPES